MDNYLTKWKERYNKKASSRYDFDLDLILKTFDPSKSIAELGGAPFKNTFRIAKERPLLTSFDIKPERFLLTFKNLPFKVEPFNLELDIYEKQEFDGAFLFEVIEHLSRPLPALANANKMLKKEGVFIISTPNLYSYKRIIQFIRGKGFDEAVVHMTKFEKLGHNGHMRLYTHNQLTKLLNKAGFEVVQKQFINHHKRTLLSKLLNKLRISEYMYFTCRKM